MIYSYYMYINRYPNIENLLEPGKVLVVYGPRQCGKTSLVKKYLETTNYQYIFETGTLRNIQQKFINGAQQSIIDDYGTQYQLVVIDEAQMIPNIGESMKALVDLYPTIRVILTGSSSFDLAGQVGEPLLGRQTILNMYPLWESEIAASGFLTPGEHIEQSLLYGHYPEIYIQKTPDQKIKKLQDIAHANLFKDILAFDRLKKPQVIIDLLSLLAYQLGNEVSQTELATKLGITQKTVEHYLTILEQAFIIMPLRAYATNHRNEIRTKKKYYFIDLGIRNALINNFSSLSTRDDVGALWENYCIIERMKKLSYTNQWAETYFWRSFTQTEVDYIEIKDGTLSAYEIKWNAKKQFVVPKLFSEQYPHAIWEIINPDTYQSFVR